MTDYAYPRPQMRRGRWMSLDGTWEVNGQDITVPFPPQAPASGFAGTVPSALEYKKTFTLPADWPEGRTLLHFGAVDETCLVRLNGEDLGGHEGGYLPFTLDVTDEIRRGEENLLEVSVRDELSGFYPYGKQSRKPHGMWYTPVSGIWQSVWLEPVPEDYIAAVYLTPDENGVRISLESAGAPVRLFQVRLIPGEDGEGEETVWRTYGGSGAYMRVRYPRLWSPEDPYLYHAQIRTDTDEVTVYFALRTVEIRREGVPGIFLNGKRIFLHAVLDQGYFPEGLYTAPSPEAYEKDLRLLQEMGFNAVRKHAKVEPEAFYYACDRLGIPVVQDMVNSGEYHYLRDTVLPTFGVGLRRDDKPDSADEERRALFLRCMKETQEHLYSHPCVVMYTLFNEGWGQFNADKVCALARETDPTRLYDATSGWFHQKDSDVESLHIYFRNKVLRPKGDRPLFLSECGGFSLPVPGHMNRDKSYGYGACRTREQLTEKLVTMYDKMVIPAIGRGLCGAVLTQLTDIEEEINGLCTYDREAVKPDLERMRKIAERIRNELETL